MEALSMVALCMGATIKLIKKRVFKLYRETSNKKAFVRVLIMFFSEI